MWSGWWSKACSHKSIGKEYDHCSSRKNRQLWTEFRFDATNTRSQWWQEFWWWGSANYCNLLFGHLWSSDSIHIEFPFEGSSHDRDNHHGVSTCMRQQEFTATMASSWWWQYASLDLIIVLLIFHGVLVWLLQHNYIMPITCSMFQRAWPEMSCTNWSGEKFFCRKRRVIKQERLLSHKMRDPVVVSSLLCPSTSIAHVATTHPHLTRPQMLVPSAFYCSH